MIPPWRDTQARDGRVPRAWTYQHAHLRTFDVTLKNLMTGHRRVVRVRARSMSAACAAVLHQAYKRAAGPFSTPHVALGR